MAITKAREKARTFYVVPDFRDFRMKIADANLPRVREREAAKSPNREQQPVNKVTVVTKCAAVSIGLSPI